jgi:hypothetical protein
MRALMLSEQRGDWLESSTLIFGCLSFLDQYETTDDISGKLKASQLFFALELLLLLLLLLLAASTSLRRRGCCCWRRRTSFLQKYSSQKTS